MTPIIQIMIGISIGIISALLLTPLAIGYVNTDRNRNTNSSKQTSRDFLSKPGDTCPICLCEMESNKMQYLPCLHALHEECLKNHRKFSKHCPSCRMEL